MHYDKGRPYLLLCSPSFGSLRRMIVLLLLELLQLQAVHYMSLVALVCWDRKAKIPKSYYLLYSSPS